MLEVKKTEQEGKNLLWKTAIHHNFNLCLFSREQKCQLHIKEKPKSPFVGDYIILVLIIQILHHFHDNL